MMPGNTAFLSDTYWPMAIGQFGWIGAFVYIMIFVRIFQTFKRSGTVGEAKAFQYAIFIQLMIQAIGTAIISSSAGFIAFAALSLYSIPTLEYNKEKNETKIKRIPKRKLKISF